MDKAIMVCPICGVKFKRSFTHRVTCSDECREEKARRDRSRYYHKYAERRWNEEFPGIPYSERKRRQRKDKVKIPLPKPKEYKYKPGVFDAKLKELRDKGLDYTEEQKKQTIEMYGRIRL